MMVVKYFWYAMDISCCNVGNNLYFLVAGSLELGVFCVLPAFYVVAAPKLVMNSFIC